MQIQRKILVTGGCGKIGSYFIRNAPESYWMRVVDKTPWDVDRLGPLRGESWTANLQDPQACRQACEGMEMVVHLAADPDPDSDFLDSLLPNNILAAYHLFQAAKEAGCRRLIYASSAHAVSAYPQGVQIHTGMPVRPANLYGVTKCLGEALAAYFAYEQALPVITIRIGAYLFPNELDQLLPEEMDGYLHPDDFNQLLIRCLETPNVTFAIVHAISNNRYKRLDLTETCQLLDYQPQADVFEMLNIFPSPPLSPGERPGEGR
jgi:nucleoside-diphosphate-sugar epimerase